jgi:hypothetical protein
MRRNSFKLAALAGLALVGGAVGVNCSNGSNPKTGGDIKLAVVLPGGVHIDTISYKVQNSANATIAGPGSFSVTDPNATISLDIVVPVTPTGDAGDTVVLTATDSLGNSCTGTSAHFPVVAGTNPAVAMTLACGSATSPISTGNIGVTATVVEGDHCPNITSGVVAPDQTSVGAAADVAAVATDADTTETVTYAWAPAANFASPTSASTTYTCTTAGVQTFTVTVTDSHTPTSCSTQATFTITCVGTTTTGTGGTGTGGTGTGGTGTGGTGTGGVAGMGVAGAPGTGGVAGMGVAGSTGTGGVATGGTTGTGGTPVVQGDSVACRTCELQGTTAGDCFNTSPTGQGTTAANFGCEGLTGAAQTACQNLLFCLQGQACQAAIHSADASFSEAALGFDQPLPCLCGTAFVTDASSTAHDKCVTATSGFNGVCASLFAAAANGGSVTGNFTNNQIAEGVAVNLMSCDIDHPCTSAATCAVGSLP